MIEYKYHRFTETNEMDAVQIMTVHKAKGLEFHTVFLPELQDKEFPVGNLGGKKYWSVLGGSFEQNKEAYQTDMEDERKLFYVAVTRAKKNLYLSYELSKHPVSSFVKEAADSKYVSVNRADLEYDPRIKEKETYRGYGNVYISDFGEKQKETEEREMEKEQNRQYWEAVKYARAQLYDYYGTATHFCKAAYGDLISIKSMEPDEILRKATKMGLI